MRGDVHGQVLTRGLNTCLARQLAVCQLECVPALQTREHLSVGCRQVFQALGPDPRGLLPDSVPAAHPKPLQALNNDV